MIGYKTENPNVEMGERWKRRAGEATCMGTSSRCWGISVMAWAVAWMWHGGRLNQQGVFASPKHGLVIIYEYEL